MRNKRLFQDIIIDAFEECESIEEMLILKEMMIKEIERLYRAENKRRKGDK